MNAPKFFRLGIFIILAIILVAIISLIRTPLFTKLAALANQNLIAEPIDEPSSYYSVDASKVWPIGNTEKAQSKFDRAMAKEILSGGFINNGANPIQNSSTNVHTIVRDVTPSHQP